MPEPVDVDGVGWGAIDEPRLTIPEWMHADDFIREASTAARRLVLVPVGSFDLRAVRAVEAAVSIPARERGAIHVVTSPDEAQVLATAWEQQHWSFPLRFVENDGGIAPTMNRVVRLELAVGFDEVVVLAGKMAPRNLTLRLLHDGTAAAIERALEGIPNVLAGSLGVVTG